MTPKRTLHAWVTAALAGALLTAVAACTTTDQLPTPTPPTTTQTPTTTAAPTPSVDPEVAEAEAAVLAAYQNYWDVSAAAMADPLAPLPSDFDRYMIDKARAGLAESLLWAEQNDVVMVGAPVISPTVESITLEGDRTAHIVDCVDSTDWVLTLRSTGMPASSGSTQSPRVTADAWASFYDDRWVIREVTLNRDQPC
ncbi:MAG: hypothetical protein KQH57_08120 [Actinomycetales bacterium]|nr:hypothetical protein [Actinomycetales bacterium]